MRNWRFMGTGFTVGIKTSGHAGSGPASDDITGAGAREQDVSEAERAGHTEHCSVTQPITHSGSYGGAMAEESRGKRRKQANPRRNRGMMKQTWICLSLYIDLFV